MRRFAGISRTFVAALCLCVFATAPVWAADGVQSALNRFLQQTHTPGIALSVMHKGDSKPHNWYAGMANLELRVPVAQNTTFRIGSVTKLFTAAAAMKLVEAGKLRLDTTMAGYFPKLQGAKRITVTNLLDHSSGLPDMLYIEPFASNMAKPYTPEQLLNMVIKKGTLKFEPGQRTMYSNTEYLVLGLLIQKLSGLSYNTFLQRNVVEPLGMHRTELGSDAAIVPGRAAGYTVRKDRNGKPQIVNAQWVSIIPPFSTGGILSRPADFIRMVNLDRLLGTHMVKTMLKPAKVVHDTPVILPLGSGGLRLTIHYGMGFELLKFSDSKQVLVAKDGLIPGFCSWYVYFPQKQLAIAASANNEKAVLPLLLLIRNLAATI